MNTRPLRRLALSLILPVALVAVACSKEEKKSEPAAAASAAAKKNDKKKLPAKTAAKDKKQGKKGGDDKTQKPTAASHHASTSTTASDRRHKVESAAAEHPCDQVPDGAAECHGSELVFCSGKDLWAVDCNGLMTAAHPELFDSGTCYETDTVTDCLGLGVTDDGQSAACTSDLDLCCTEDGSCYTTH